MSARLTDAERLLRSISEASVQQTLLEELTLLGCEWHHETDSRKSPKGLPDIVGAHPSGWTIWLEVKNQVRKVTPEQQLFLRALVCGAVPVGEHACFIGQYPFGKIVGVVRPANLTEAVEFIQECLCLPRS